MNALAIRHILVPVDFSAGSRRAVEFAGLLGEKFGAGLTLLHVAEPLRIEARGWSFDYAGTKTHDSEKSEAMLRELAALIPGDESADIQLKHGTPWEAIVAWADAHRVDLIVMPTHGRSGIKHLLLGSVAERVVQHAHCPVLVIRNGKALPS